MSILKNKTVLVTGGSGSLGKSLIRELLKYPVKKIISLSRDENLIKKARMEITSPKVNFVIGDICDEEKVKQVIDGTDFVYHTAALKHVDLAERNPREVLRINILGLLNLLKKAEHVERFINISSDKAINVINCYGASKLFAEYLVRETNNLYKGLFINFRCPNFLGSRGSVIDLWKKQLERENYISITNPEMTRYFITIPNASRFIIETTTRNKLDFNQSYYPKSDVKKFRLGDLAKAFINLYGTNKTKIKIIGSYLGEKLQEDYICKVKISNISELEAILKSLKNR